MVWGQAGFFSAPPLARNSRSPRARLAFASVRLKYAKNHACSGGKRELKQLNLISLFKKLSISASL